MPHLHCVARIHVAIEIGAIVGELRSAGLAAIALPFARKATFAIHPRLQTNAHKRRRQRNANKKTSPPNISNPSTIDTIHCASASTSSNGNTGIIISASALTSTDASKYLCKY